jgi:outer membrane protein OmpA-like peptidoglycan-associated protein
MRAYIVGLALLAPATSIGQPPHPAVPLVAGLTMVGAVHEPQGDYESMVTIDRISADGLSFTLSAELPGADGAASSQVRARRTIRTADLRDARTMKVRFTSGDDDVYPGTTTFQLSTSAMEELRAKGQTSLTVIDDGYGLGGMVKGLVGDIAGAGSAADVLGGGGFTATGMLKLVEQAAVPLSLMVNGTLVALPTRHLSGRLSSEDGVRNADLYVLDDAANPVVLKMRVGHDSDTVIKIEWPNTNTSRDMESALAARRPVDVYGIYFGFNSATIRPQSDSMLGAIAGMMRREPSWTLTVTGHTDNVGGDASNLALSQRRAEAVKAALVSRGVAAERLDTGGAGASAPKATNATLEGRARNRRVELTRQ